MFIIEYMEQKICLICKNVFFKKENCCKREWANKKYCSYECYWEARKGGKGKYKAYWKGKHHSEEYKTQLSQTMKDRGIEPKIKSVRYGKDNNKWKGKFKWDKRN